MSKFSRFLVHVPLAIFAGSFCSGAPAATNSADQVSLAELKNIVCGLHPDARSLAALEREHPKLKDVTCNNATADATAKPVPAPAPARTAGKGVTQTAPKRTDQPSGNGSPTVKGPFSLLVRNDWTDAGLLGASCLQPASDNSGNGGGGGDQSSSGKGVGVDTSAAKGASVSITRDYAGNNKIWAAKGMVAGVYTECPPLALGEIIEKSITVYAQINSDYNSNAAMAKKNNVDTRTAGVSGELAYWDTHSDLSVVRVIPNVVFDNIKNTTAAAAMI